MKHFWWFVIVFLLVSSTVCANGFEPRRLPVAHCSPVQSEAVVESPSIPPGQILAESGSTIPMAISPNAIESPYMDDFPDREAKLAEREKAVEEREKAVEKREAALSDWYTKLSEYRDYLNGFQMKNEAKQEVRQTVVRPTYSAYSYGNYGGYAGSPCANGQCYGGW